MQNSSRRYFEWDKRQNCAFDDIKMSRALILKTQKFRYFLNNEKNQLKLKQINLKLFSHSTIVEGCEWEWRMMKMNGKHNRHFKCWA